ncbi:hypothetical protein COT99_04285, partial [Candidatus Falkowbacteria bacterium CG10_big_fil_rev_8_21_14_0_10_43_10]
MRKKLIVFAVIQLFVVNASLSQEIGGMLYPVGDPYALTYNVSQVYNTSYEQGFTLTNKDGSQTRYYGHLGVDLANGRSGGDVKSIYSGTVVASEQNSGFGNMVRVKHTINGEIRYSQYGHMQDRKVNVDDEVENGRIVGHIGNTGFSTNPHLDFQIKKVDSNGPGYAFGNSSLVNNYLDPLVFIAAHQHPLLGKFSDGWHESNQSSQNFIPYSVPFVDCFLANGGVSVLGIPVSEVSQRSPSIYAQEFSQNNILYTMALNPYVYNSARGYLGVCYPMCGRIRINWNPNRDGAPVTNEYNVTKG